MKHISVFSWIAAVALTALTTMNGNVIAQTPDGQTPANEGVCDVLQGGTPGLYGLCVAYCEAQDLDLVGDKETPNNKILANYRKKMKAGDPDMPCIQVPCPCWSADQLANVGAYGTPTCNTSTSVAQVRFLSPGINQQATADLNASICRFVDTQAMPPISLRFTITAQEAKSCHDQIAAKCSALGQ
ncbi:MAG: hypothetical protein Q8R61_10995 [Thiobacillus sp.]|uniref:hypothetical protein n=1 Tax=Thiobacillus sp. TaxID=924 RepID=UPI0027352B4E|nr:hypothetical protein [Thiobacillus sp.]MDP3585642.1 hypothetical protein [Thiobacillus sp.]